MGSRLDKKSTKKKRKWVKVLIISFIILFLAVGAYAFTVYNSLKGAVETMHKPLEREKSEKREEDVSLKQGTPFSVLLLGVDQRKNDRGRSDSIIVLSVNPNNNSVKMVSIPRDTRTEIVGKGVQDKINHAYAFGGVEMSIATVENFLDIPIDYYVQINMEGFKEIVDSVGGVTVQNDLDFTYEGVHFTKGQLTLNGEKALKYTRMRKEDPRGDFGRQLRQRQIIEGVIKKGASLNSLTNFGDIFSALGNNVRTNLTFNEMVTIQSKYKSASNSMEQTQINGGGTKIDGVYYYMVPAEEKQRITTMLKEQLEIK
ncbi:LCP family protein required for cell wall assembly [Neobacillus niacini]|uniref:polyisoprenyl-teichoic acid--peptidoglycan teichoic acid transferase TagU n=1 Tax=Neobacillus niacini TaxID=86668 RepID=UPI00285B861C|nr:LytR family transcriptional regulator [Neobacillus niacini]MDR7078850.1 LCP family protein required for cell wall assembly [Neobacillus niacini]